MNDTFLLFFPQRLGAKYESQYLENGPLATTLNSRTQIRVHGKGKNKQKKAKQKTETKEIIRKPRVIFLPNFMLSSLRSQLFCHVAVSILQNCPQI